MKYKVLLEREYIARETCERVIDAASDQDAQDQAFRLALEFDADCPADRQLDTAGADCGDWTFTVGAGE